MSLNGAKNNPKIVTKITAKGGGASHKPPPLNTPLMSVFDHVYYPFHHDHINTPRKHPLITPFELQMVGGCRMKTGGVITPRGVWINHWPDVLPAATNDLRVPARLNPESLGASPSP